MVMQDENYQSHFLNHSLKENALWAMQKCDFHFNGDISRELFITDRQYAAFMRRAEQLGITQKNDPDQIHWCRQHTGARLVTDEALMEQMKEEWNKLNSIEI